VVITAPRFWYFVCRSYRRIKLLHSREMILSLHLSTTQCTRFAPSNDNIIADYNAMRQAMPCGIARCSTHYTERGTGSFSSADPLASRHSLILQTIRGISLMSDTNAQRKAPETSEVKLGLYSGANRRHDDLTVASVEHWKTAKNGGRVMNR
jgi:hypothetical protein